MIKYKHLIIFILLIFSCKLPSLKPNSVDTLPLLNLSRTEWPEHALFAVEHGIHWGQCGICGFPVTDEDIKNGFGTAKNHKSKKYTWNSYLCWRHN